MQSFVSTNPSIQTQSVPARNKNFSSLARLQLEMPSWLCETNGVFVTGWTWCFSDILHFPINHTLKLFFFRLKTESRKISLKRSTAEGTLMKFRAGNRVVTVWLSLDITFDTFVVLKLNYQMQLIELSGIKTCSQFSLLCIAVRLVRALEKKFLHIVRNFVSL